MTRKLSLLFAALLLAIIAAACGTTPTAGTTGGASGAAGGAAPTPAAETEITVKHQLGETKVKTNPKKVVVFDFGVLDSLDKLGVEITGVPQANIPPYLAKYKDAKYKNVGSLKEPDFEKISAIAPDLILISGRQSAAYEELTKLGPTIYMGVDNKKYMESFTENAKTLGKIFGKEAAVDQELTKINDSIKQLKDKATKNGKNALVILAEESAVSAFGPGSRFGIIYDVFGVTPVDKNIEVSTHGQTISFEYLVEKDPDYLFVIDRSAAVGNGQSAAKKVIENELVKTKKAYKNGNVVYLDQNYWYLSGGGLVSVSEMVREVSEGLK